MQKPNKTQFMKNLEVFQKYNINDKIILKDSSFCVVKKFDSFSGSVMLHVSCTETCDDYLIDPEDVAMIVN